MQWLYIGALLIMTNGFTIGYDPFVWPAMEKKKKKESTQVMQNL